MRTPSKNQVLEVNKRVAINDHRNAYGDNLHGKCGVIKSVNFSLNFPFEVLIDEHESSLWFKRDELWTN